MGERMIPVRNRGYIRGVNNKLLAFDIRDDEAAELQTIDSQFPGQTKKRQGSSIVATGITLGPIKALGYLSPHPNEGDARILAVSPNVTDGSEAHYRLWEWDGTGSEFTEVGTLTGFTAATEDVVILQHYELDHGTLNTHVAVISGDHILGNRYGYDGTNLVEIDGFGESMKPPHSAIFESAYYRLFGAGAQANRNRVYFSDVGSGLASGSWGANNSAAWTFGGNSAGQVVAIKQYRPNLLMVFLSDKIEALIVRDVQTGLSGALGVFRGADDTLDHWRREAIDPQIGCGSRLTVQTTGEDIFFVDQFGNVRSIAQTIADSRSGTRSLPVSDPIQGFIDRINKAYLGKSVAISYDRFYYVAFPLDSATTPDHLFRFDVTRRAWDGPWTGLDPARFVVGVLDASGASDSDKQPRIYMGQNRVGYGDVRQIEVGTDDAGSSIEFKQVTKRYTLDSLELLKRWVRLELFAIGTADVDMRVEANPGGRGWSDLGSFNLLGDAPILPQDLTFVLGGVGVSQQKFSLEGLPPTRDIQFRFTADTTSEVKIVGFTLTAFPENYEWGEVSN